MRNKPIHLLGKRKKIWLDNTLIDLAFSAMFEVERQTGYHHHPIAFLPDYYSLYERNGIAANYTRISVSSWPFYTLIALIPEAQKALLPGFRTHDFIELILRFEVTDPEEIVVLHALCGGEVGTFQRNCWPIRIRNRDDLLRLQIDPTVVDFDAISSQTTVWWQKWGGCLFAFTFSCEEGAAIAEETPIAWRVGKYKRVHLPDR